MDSNAATPLESPASGDGPLLSSATNALQELVFSVNSARGDVASATAIAQAEITAKLKGTSEAAAKAFEDASTIANFFEAECQEMQTRITRETARHVEAEEDRKRLAVKSDGLEEDLGKWKSDLEATREREQSFSAELDTVREDNRRLRLGAGAGNGGGGEASPALVAQLDQLGDDVAKANAALRLAEAEAARLKSQNAELETRLQGELARSGPLQEQCENLQNELTECVAVASRAPARVAKMKERLQQLMEQKTETDAELQRLQYEMSVKSAEQSATLEQERAIHQQERSRLLDGLTSPSPAANRSSSLSESLGGNADDVVQSVEFELQRLRTEHAQQLQIMKRDTDTLKQEVERKHQSLIATHSAVEIMRDEHESFRQSSQRDAGSVQQVADMKRTIESLQQQLSLQHTQLQLAMQGKAVGPPASPWSGAEPAHSGSDQMAKLTELEQALVGARETQDALIEELEAAHADHSVKVDATVNDLERRHNAELEDLKRQIAEKQGDADALAQEKEDLQNTVVAMNQTIVEKLAERDEERERLEQLQGELQEEGAAHAETQQRHAAQVQQHFEEIKLLQDESATIVEQKVTLDRQVREIDSALKQARENMLVERHELERREEALRASHSQAVSEWENKRQDLTMAHNELDEALNATAAELQAEKENHAQSVAERDDITDQHSELYSQHQLVSQAHDNVKVAHAEMTAAHEEAAAERDAIRGAHTEVSAAHKSASDDVTELSAHREALQLELSTTRQKAAEAHATHVGKHEDMTQEAETLGTALQVSETAIQTLQQELADSDALRARTHEDWVASNEQLSAMRQEVEDLQNAQYKSKEDTAVELSEIKKALEDEVVGAKEEGARMLAEAKAASEEGYAALQERFDAQVAELEKVQEEHSKTESFWEAIHSELSQVSEESVKKVAQALAMAEAAEQENADIHAKHSDLMSVAEQKHDAHAAVSYEVEGLRAAVEEKSKALTELMTAKEEIEVAYDADKQQWASAALHAKVDSLESSLATATAELEHATSMQQAKDAELETLRKAAAQHDVQLATVRKQTEGAIARRSEAMVKTVEELTASKESIEGALRAEQQHGEELAVDVMACKLEIAALEELRDANDRLAADADVAISTEEKMAVMEHDHAEQLAALSASSAGELATVADESTKKLEEALGQTEAAVAKTEEAETEAQRLTEALAAAHAELAQVQEENFVERRTDMDRLTDSLSIAHASVKTLEEERAEQAREMEAHAGEVEALKAKALAGQNALLTTANQALALTEDGANSALNKSAEASPPGRTTSPTSMSVVSTSSRARRSSWVSETGQMEYECELGTGFRGTFEEVKEHEAQIKAMREETKVQLAQARPSRSAAMPSAREFAPSSSDYRYGGLAATIYQPAPSPVRRPHNSAAELLFNALDVDGDGVITRDEMRAGLQDQPYSSRTDLSMRSADLSYMDRGALSVRSAAPAYASPAPEMLPPTSSTNSTRASDFASRAEARKARLGLSSASRAPRREPGAGMSEGEPPMYARRGSAASDADGPRRPRYLAEDRD